ANRVEAARPRSHAACYRQGVVGWRRTRGLGTDTFAAHGHDRAEGGERRPQRRRREDLGCAPLGAMAQRPPMWVCPSCGRTFANRNQTHTCAYLGELDRHFARSSPEVRATFDPPFELIQWLQSDTGIHET